MIYTEPNGRKKVRCDSCGIEISHCGTMASEDEHFCDECSTPADQEFRICMGCGEPMVDGMTNLETVYVCEECFKPWMDENCPEGWREVDDDGYDGYYEERINGEWVGTGIFYTTWY